MGEIVSPNRQKSSCISGWEKLKKKRDRVLALRAYLTIWATSDHPQDALRIDGTCVYQSCSG